MDQMSKRSTNRRELPFLGSFRNFAHRQDPVGSFRKFLFRRLSDFQNALARRIENSNRTGRINIFGLWTWQYDRTRPVIKVVNVDDLWMGILKAGYREANWLHRLKRSDEADNSDGKCNRHLEADRRQSVASLGCIWKYPHRSAYLGKQRHH